MDWPFDNCYLIDDRNAGIIARKTRWIMFDWYYRDMPWWAAAFVLFYLSPFYGLAILSLTDAIEPTVLPWMNIVCALLLLFPGVWLVISVLDSYWRAFRMATHGIFILGEVTNIRPQRIEFDFLTPDGRLMRGLARRDQSKPPPSKGDHVNVFYLNDRCYRAL